MGRLIGGMIILQYLMEREGEGAWLDRHGREIDR